jgi:hypothetical protein
MFYVYAIYTRPLSAQARYSRSCRNICSLSYNSYEVAVEVSLRPTVSRPVGLGVRRPSGTCDQFLFLLEISFRQLRVCYFVAPSLTRGRVCNLLVQLLLGLARAVSLGSKSRRTHDHISLSHLRLPQPGGPGSVFISPRMSPGESPIKVGVSEWVNLRPTVSRPVCPGVRRPSGTCDQFFFLLEISFIHLRFCKFVGPPLCNYINTFI